MPPRRFLVLLPLAASLAGCPPRDPEDGGRADVLVLTQSGEPAEGAIVFSHDRNGVLLDVGNTVGGEERVVVEDGDMISAYYSFTDEFGLEIVSVSTVVGVERGDDLFITVAGLPPAESSQGTVTLTLGGQVFGGADDYVVALAGCPGANGSTSNPSGSSGVDVSTLCDGNSFTPWAYARAGGLPVAFQILPAAPLTDLLASGAAFAGPWRTDFDATGFALTNLPPTSFLFTLAHTLYDADARYLFDDGAAALITGVASTSGTLATIPFTEASFASANISTVSTNGTITWLRSSAPGDLALDFATMPSYLTIASAGTSSGGQLQFSWAGGPATADMLQLDASYATTKNRIVTWTFTLEAASPASVFVFPEWPAELPQDDPPANETLIDQGHVRFTDGEWADWDEARQQDPREGLAAQDRRSVMRLLE